MSGFTSMLGVQRLGQFSGKLERVGRPIIARIRNRKISYTKRRALFLSKYQTCAICAVRTPEQVQVSSSVHHSRGRLGALLLDERFWVPSCAGCHDHVHRHPAWAREHGFLCAVGLWNVAPKEP